MHLLRAGSLLALFLLLCLCCGSSGDDPATAAGGFLRAVRSGDEAAMSETLTEKARAGMSSGGGVSLNGAKIESFTLGESRVDSETAEVAVRVVDDGTTQDADVLLRREANEWRVYGMRMQLGESSFTVNLEEPGGAFAALGESIGEELQAQMQVAFDEMQTSIEQGGTAEEIEARREAFEGIEGWPPDQLEMAWQVDVDGGGRAALVVLEELVTTEGLAIDAGEHAEALATPVTITLGGVSRVEAVERVAEVAGLHPVWPVPEPSGFFGEPPDPDPLTFAPGPRPWTALFEGPFLLEITEVTENAPNPTGSIELAVRALGLPRGVLALQEGEYVEMLRLEAVRGAAGQPLADEDVWHMGAPEMRARYLSYTIEKDLTGLVRAVEAIDEIAGEIRISVPTSVETVAWERGDERPRALDAGTLRVESWGELTQFELAGNEAELEGLVIRASPRVSSGDPLGVLYTETGGWGSTIRAGVQCPETPAAVDLKLCRVEELAYPFTIRNVPLHRFAEQPERVESLAFDGAAPIEIRLTGPMRRDGDRLEVTLQIENRSNKDATSLMVQFVYLDAAGKQLDDFPHTLTGSWDFDLEGVGALVAAGETVQHESWAAFAPDATASIRFELVSAEFPDGTTWETESD